MAGVPGPLCAIQRVLFAPSPSRDALSEAVSDAPQDRSSGPGSFQKKFPQTLEEVQQSHADQRVEVWFQDESRFGQQGSLTRVCADRGSRPRCPRQTEYKWVSLFGAVCPATSEFELPFVSRTPRGVAVSMCDGSALNLGVGGCGGSGFR